MSYNITFGGGHIDRAAVLLTDDEAVRLRDALIIQYPLTRTVSDVSRAVESIEKGNKCGEKECT